MLACSPSRVAAGLNRRIALAPGVYARRRLPSIPNPPHLRRTYLPYNASLPRRRVRGRVNGVSGLVAGKAFARCR